MYFIKNNLFSATPLIAPLDLKKTFYKNYTLADLPNSYLNLLKEQNGGYLTKNLLPTAEPTRDGLASVGFHYLFGLQENPEVSLLQQEHYHQQYSLPDYFLFFSVNDEQLWAFDYSQLNHNEPSIRYLDMDTDQWLHIADSFAEFLQLLQTAPLDLNEERILTRHEANHSFLLASLAELELLATRFEDYPDKEWYFNWLIQLAQSSNKEKQQLAFTAFETQVFYFHPVLPANTSQLRDLFQALDADIIEPERLTLLLKEL